MDNDIQKPKSNIHIHVGGAIIIIIILFVLFKVNIKSFINSPQFQGNVNYIEQTGQDIWNKYLSKPVMYVWDNVIFGNAISQGIKQIQSVTPNLKIPAVDQSTITNTFNLNAIQKKIGIPADDSSVPQN